MKFNKYLIAFVVISLTAITCSLELKLNTNTDTETQTMGNDVNAKLICAKSNDISQKSMWVVYDKVDIQNSKSGISFRNYYSSDKAANCPYLNNYKKDGKYNYFLSFRNFVKAKSNETAFYKMRQFYIISRGYNVLYFNIRKMFSPMSWKDMNTMINNINSNLTYYLKYYRKYKWNMFYSKINAEGKQNERDKKIENEQEEIASIKAEIQILQETLKELKAKAIESQNLSRNLGNQIEIIRNKELKPLVKKSSNNILMVESLQEQYELNQQKIQNIVAIDHDDLSDSIINLKKKLILYQATYLEQDDTHSKLANLINNLDTQKHKIPYLLYN